MVLMFLKKAIYLSLDEYLLRLISLPLPYYITFCLFVFLEYLLPTKHGCLSQLPLGSASFPRLFWNKKLYFTVSECSPLNLAILNVFGPMGTSGILKMFQTMTAIESLANHNTANTRKQTSEILLLLASLILFYYLSLSLSFILSKWTHFLIQLWPSIYLFSMHSSGISNYI